MKAQSIVLASLAVLLAALPATAAVPEIFTYAGTLKQGSAPANGTFAVVATLFDDETAGASVFSQTEAALVVVDGELILDLGADPTNPLTDDLLAGGPLFLSVTVNGEELSPRVPLTSVPFARIASRAQDADTVGGLGPDDFEALIPSPGSGLVLDGNTNVLSLAPNGVGSAQIADGTVGSVDLAADAVTSAKIAVDAVGASEVAADAVGSAEIAPGAVGTSEIADGAISSPKLALSAVTTASLADGAVTAQKLATASVGQTQIATSGVGNLELAGIETNVFLQPRGCGGGLNTQTACSTLMCGIFSGTNLPRFLDCSGNCVLTSADSCSGTADGFTFVGKLLATNN